MKAALYHPSHAGYPGHVRVGPAYEAWYRHRMHQNQQEMTRWLTGCPDGYSVRHEFGRGYVFERYGRGGAC